MLVNIVMCKCWCVHAWLQQMTTARARRARVLRRETQTAHDWQRTPRALVLHQQQQQRLQWELVQELLKKL